MQGSVLLEIVVDENGWPLDIEVLSPLGFGLDEKAVEAVSPWRFKPGEKEGRPVAVRARVEVAFRLTDKGFDPKAERRRAPFNSIVARLGKTPDQKPREQDATAMGDLARQKFAAACYALGIWQTAGRGVPQDVAAGLANIQKAADQKYGPALLFIGRAAISGDSMPKNTVKGLGLVREAALLGSADAQFILGGMYQEGKDRERSKRYYRLCAASAMPECEFRLGQLLIGSPQRKEADWLQGIAWLEVARSHDFVAAQAAVTAELTKLSGEAVRSRWAASRRCRGSVDRCRGRWPAR